MGVIKFCSYNFSIRATLSSLIMFELFPARFSCGSKFDLSHNLSGFSGKETVLNPDASIAILLKISFSLDVYPSNFYFEHVYQKAFHP